MTTTYYDDETPPTQKAPGKFYRKGMSIKELFYLFPNDEAARKWFEAKRWPNGIRCTDCGSDRISAVKHKSMPYRCKDCRSYFSVTKGTAMQHTKVGLQDWAIAIYMVCTGLKGTSSMKLHRELGVTQKTAWYMLQRIRETFADEPEKLSGTVEVDEMYVGGKQRNRHKKDKARYSAEDNFGKKMVVGVVERDSGKAIAKVIDRPDMNTLTRFVEENVRFGSKVMTDDHSGYTDLMESFRHFVVQHSLGEYVRGVDVHTNTIESLWSMFKRGYVGVYHRMSWKHLHRYLNEFTGRKGIREDDTIDQMERIATGLVGKHMTYRELTS